MPNEACTRSPLLAVERIGKAFKGRTVIQDVSFTMAHGEVLGLIGRSGSGKSTLLRCLNMLERPDQGWVRLDGEDIGLQGPQRRPVGTRTLARQRAAMSMVFQHFNLWPHRTVLENVIEGPMRVLGLPRSDAVARAMPILERIGMASQSDQYPVTLSGGQQQRTAIARAVAMQPRLILFDEPTSALDPELVNEVLAVMRDLAQAGTTMLVVTHEMRFALDVCHRILFMEQGRLADTGTPAELQNRPPQSTIRKFLDSAQLSA